MAQQLKSELKVILRHSSIFGLSNVLGQVISILLLPLYTRYLTPTDYGALEILYFVSTIIGIMIGMGITDAMTRFYFDSDDRDKRNQVVSTTIIGIGALYVVVCLALTLLSPYLAVWLLDSKDYTIHFQVLFVTLIPQYATAVAAAYLRVEQRSFTLLLMSLVQMLLTIGLNIYLIVYVQWGSLGMLTATFITHSVIGAVAVFLILRRTGIRFERQLYRNMIKFGLPLIPSSLGSYVAIASDRFFVKEYVSLSETGLYSLGYKVGSMIHSFLTAPFIQIWFPRRYEYFGQENAEQVFARIFSYFMAVLVFAALGVSLLSRDILKVMTAEAFWPAYRIVPVIALAHVIHAFYYHFTIAITYKKQTKYYAYLNVMVGILNLLLNFLLIKAYSVWGAAFATLITYLFRSGMVYYYADRLEPIVFEVGRAIKVLLCAIAVYAVGFLVASESLFTDIGIQLFVLMLYPILLFATGFITRQEIATARQYIGQFRRKLTRSRNNDGMDESDQLEQQKEKR